MTIRQQYANEELVHKLRSMLNDLPTLRTRALKKLKHWREAAIKRLLARQRELEKTLLEKFERLEYDTIHFVDKIERKKLHQQRYLQNDSFDYQNKSEIDRISNNLRMIREELEQSKLILAAGAADDEIDDLIGDDLPPGKLPGTSRYGGTLSSKTSMNKSQQETNDLGSELKRVLDICTSPQRSSSSLSADEMKYGFILPKSKALLTKKKKTKKFDAHQLNSVSKVKLSPLQSLDHTEHSYDTKSKQTTTKGNSTVHPKPGSQSVVTPRKNTRAIPNGSVPIQNNDSTNHPEHNGISSINGSNHHKLFAFESFDDSIRRFQRLREIRKNLRTKYDDHSVQPSVDSKPPVASPPTAVSNNVTDSVVESTSDNRNGSQQKLLNYINRSIPPTPPTTKSSSKTNGNSTTPRKNGETRHTLFSREPVSIPIERVAAPPPVPPPPPPPAPVPAASVPSSTSEINGSQSADPNLVELYDQAADSVNPKKKTSDSRERRHRSRTLEAHQVQAVDNQIYGCPPSSKAKQNTQQRSESQKHRSQRLSIRRSSEDHQDKYMQLRRSHEFHGGSTQNILNETWFDVAPEHWSNLLENGWRPTADTPGITPVAIADADRHSSRTRKQQNSVVKPIDLYEQVSRNEYYSFFEQLEFAYARTINLGNEFWRFLEIDGSHHLCLYHQLNKQFIMYKPEVSLLSFPWPYDGIVDISWSKTSQNWIVATQTQIVICNRSFSKILQSVDINGDWPKRITSCQSSIFHTYKIPPSSITSSTSSTSSYLHSSNKDRPQFLLERYDYKLNSLGKHILESSTIWDIEADDLTEHLAILCDVALLIFDYQLNLLKQIEVTGFKVSRDYFGGWLVADYNASCLWQIRRNEFVKANKILHVERPWSVILDRSSWNLVTLSETQNRAKRLLFFNMKNIPASLASTVNSPRTQSQLSASTSSSISNSST